MDEFGSSVSSAGDVNGDRIDDLLIGAGNASPDGKNEAGKSYILFGNKGIGASGSIDLSSLTGVNGFMVNGEQASDWSGSTVTSVKDVNGDGIDDLAIGAYKASPNGKQFAGKSYILFGSIGLGATGTIDLSSLNGSSGFSVEGEQPGDHLGVSISQAGDVNHDGINDLVIGAYRAQLPPRRNEAGKTYVLFGNKLLGASGKIDLTGLNGTTGFVINGIQVNDRSGSSVSNAGDVNGDGIDDLLIGAYYASPNGKTRAGSTYILFGKIGLGNSGIVELNTLNASSGAVVKGAFVNDQLSSSVSYAGDVNGDGINDILLGAANASPSGRVKAGKTYVLYGKIGLGRSGTIGLSTLTGSKGFLLRGEMTDDRSGAAVSYAGDLNKDGIDDIATGAYSASSNGNSQAGKTYVIYGKKGLETSENIELSALNNTQGFVLNGEQALDYSGYSVASAGDVNDDGIDDIVIGARDASPGGRKSAGKAYVLFGRAIAQPPPPTSKIPSGTRPLLNIPIDSITVIVGVAVSVVVIASSIFSGVFCCLKHKASKQEQDTDVAPQNTPPKYNQYDRVQMDLIIQNNAYTQAPVNNNASNQYDPIDMPLDHPNSTYSKAPSPQYREIDIKDPRLPDNKIH